MSTPSLTPEMQQALMRMLQPGGQGMQPGMMQPPVQSGQQGGGQPQMPRMGGNNQVMPSGTAVPMVPGVPMSATPPRPTSAIAGSGIGMIPAAVAAIKQGMSQKKAQKARASASEWIAIQQDPNMKKQLEELAKSDPKLAKVLEKKQQDFIKMYDNAIKDPNSPEYQGIQMAYRDQLSQEQQKIEMTKMKAQADAEQAKVGAEQARGKQEEAHAALYEKQAEQEGQVTPAKQAEITQKNAAQAEATKRIQMQVDQRIKTTRMQIDGMLKATDKRVAAMRDALGVSKDDKTVSNLAKDYSNLNAQIKTLNDESSKMQKDLSDHPIKYEMWSTEEGAKIRNKIEANQAQTQILQQQLKLIEQKRQIMLQMGVLPPETGNIGTTQEPITVSPEDMPQ